MRIRKSTKNCGPYRDDGLLTVKKHFSRKIDQFIKSIMKTFQKNDLKNYVIKNLCSQRLDFLDVTRI